MKIVVNAGHGPDTAGKRTPDGSLREFHFNAPTARYTAARLLEYEGVEILHPFDDSRDVPLKERTDRANSWPADLYLSIHANAYGDSWNETAGIETYVHKSRPAEALTLANAVQKKLVEGSGRPDRGVKTADFHELRETHMTAVLVECGFMTNRGEAALLKSDAYRRICAESIAAAVAQTYGLKRRRAEGSVGGQGSGQPAAASTDEPQAGTSAALPPVSEWARAARDWAVAAGITDGSRPQDAVTREEVWTMLWRMRRQ